MYVSDQQELENADVIKRGFNGIFDYTGRTRGRDFWGLAVVLVVFSVFLLLMSTVAGNFFGETVARVMYIVRLFGLTFFGLVFLAAAVRRLRDAGRHWAFMFVALVPVLGTIALIVLLSGATKLDPLAEALGTNDQPRSFAPVQPFTQFPQFSQKAQGGQQAQGSLYPAQTQAAPGFMGAPQNSGIDVSVNGMHFNIGSGGQLRSHAPLPPVQVLFSAHDATRQGGPQSGPTIETPGYDGPVVQPEQPLYPGQATPNTGPVYPTTTEPKKPQS